ncbi:hypothetical protein L7F22_009765 [Adiantum nelumboides]|nr:hypothetical protein [Adiantum nelumboides]
MLFGKPGGDVAVAEQVVAAQDGGWSVAGAGPVQQAAGDEADRGGRCGDAAQVGADTGVVEVEATGRRIERVAVLGDRQRDDPGCPRVRRPRRARRRCARPGGRDGSWTVRGGRCRCVVGSARASPVRHRAVAAARDRQQGGLVGVARGERLVDVDTEPGGVAGVQVAVDAAPGVPEHLVCGLGVAHVLLDAVVGRREGDVQGRGHRDRGHVRRAVRADPDLPRVGQRREPAQGADPAGVGDGGPGVVDELLGDELLELPDRGEHLADRERGRGVGADPAQDLLVLAGGDVLEPVQVDRLQRTPEAGRLDRGEPVVGVVQERELRSDVRPDLGQRGRCVAQVGRGVPGLLGGHGAPAGGLVAGAATDAVDGVEAGHAGLDADRGEPALDDGVDGVAQLRGLPAGGVGVGAHPVPDRAAEQPVHRQPRGLAEDVPQREVDGADRGHRDRAAPPVGAPVEVLPGVLDAPRSRPTSCGHRCSRSCGRARSGAPRPRRCGRSPGHRHDVAQLLAGDEPVHVRADVRGPTEEGLAGQPRGVRGHQHVPELGEGLRRRRRVCAPGRRVAVPDVDRGAGEHAVAQRREQRVLVDQRAATDVDQHGPRAHRGELGRAQQSLGLGGQRRADHDDVGDGEQLTQPVCGGARPVQARGVGVDCAAPGHRDAAGTERAQAVPGPGSDVSEADESHDGAGQRLRPRRGRVVGRGRPLPRPQRAVLGEEPAPQQDRGRQDVLGDRVLVVEGVRDDAPGRQRVDDDAVGPGAGGVHQPQSRPCGTGLLRGTARRSGRRRRSPRRRLRRCPAPMATRSRSPPATPRPARFGPPAGSGRR